MLLFFLSMERKKRKRKQSTKLEVLLKNHFSHQLHLPFLHWRSGITNTTQWGLHTSHSSTPYPTEAKIPCQCHRGETYSHSGTFGPGYYIRIEFSGADKSVESKMGIVAHACNPSYSGGRD
jgi:hypothetical protein